MTEDGRSIQNFGGPNNPRTGSLGTTYGQVDVLDPEIRVIKEVCSTGTGCDPNSSDVPVPDGSVNDGEWVDLATIPADSTTVEWRITAVNSGNVALTDIHVAQDNWGYTDSEDMGTASITDCQALTFEDLAPNESLSMVCTTDLSGEALNGSLVNGINLNASVIERPDDPWARF